MKICPVGAQLFYADGQTDMTKLIDPFRNCANAPKTSYYLLKYKLLVIVLIMCYILE